jgi:hypothetical protein
LDLQARDYDEVVHRVTMRRQDMRVVRRFAEMDEVLERAGLLARCRLGRGQLLFLRSSRATHEFLLEQLQRDPYFLVAPSHRPQNAPAALAVAAYR